MNILALNAGSSTLKYKLFSLSDRLEDADGQKLLLGGMEEHGSSDTIIKAAQTVVEKCRPYGIDGVGYRVVHGGTTFTEPTRIDANIIKALRALEFLDPLHNPAEASMIEAGLKELAGVPAVAVFDTAFHSTLPEVAWRYALPRDLSDRLHIRRYGFHGISYSYVSQKLLNTLNREALGTKMVVCHLGSGASVCAIKDGKSIDTSMGMTPLEGLVMGTRSGDLDAGLMLYLQKAGRMTLDGLDYLLNHSSGLLGLSGRSDDVRILEQAAARDDELAEISLEVYSYRISKYIGAYCAALQGIDYLAFAGGVGEKSADIRRRVCDRLSYLGIDLASEKNEAAVGDEDVSIGSEKSIVGVWVIPTNEELEVAWQTHKLLTTTDS